MRILSALLALFTFVKIFQEVDVIREQVQRLVSLPMWVSLIPVSSVQFILWSILLFWAVIALMDKTEDFHRSLQFESMCSGICALQSPYERKSYLSFADPGGGSQRGMSPPPPSKWVFALLYVLSLCIWKWLCPQQVSPLFLLVTTEVSSPLPPLNNFFRAPFLCKGKNVLDPPLPPAQQLFQDCN